MKFLFKFALISALIIGHITPMTLSAQDKSFPFAAGEKLIFSLKWSFVPVGQAVLEVAPMTTVAGVSANHFIMHAKTNNFADVFYKVRDRVEGYTDRKMTHSVLYKKKQREGQTKRDVVVRFDWKKKEVHYSTLTEKSTPVPVLDGTFDPLSAFYYARLYDPEKYSVIKRPITDGKKCVMGKIEVVGREKIEVNGIIYDTYLVMPELKHVGGVFKKSKNAKIWLWITADHRRILVKIKSKVIVGSFVGELTAIESG
jgi:hypothetical protein